MPIEIEKKYRLTKQQADAIIKRLQDLPVETSKVEFEENTLYESPALNLDGGIVRLRRIEGCSTLTYKKRYPSASGIKHQLEEETGVADPDATDAILRRLGLLPSLVYEKRRQTWKLERAEVAVDELPFGWFMEIEGEENDIAKIERELAMEDVECEEATYPALTRIHGKVSGNLVEARFS